MAKKSKQSFLDSLLENLNNSVGKTYGIFFSKKLPDSIISQGSVGAINRYGFENEKVLAKQWIGNYYLYIIIKFNGKDRTYIYTVSVSIFYGDKEDPIQILRADWDGYPLKDGYNHPQPHWHFTALNSERIRSFKELGDEQNDQDMFLKLQPSPHTLKLEKIHFAMAGNMILDNIICQPISNQNDIINWLMNLLEHLKQEFTYISDYNDK